MEEMHGMCRRRDFRLILMLKNLVTDYNPSSQILQRLMDYSPTAQAAAAGAGSTHEQRLIA
jgi:hypothetical protein